MMEIDGRSRISGMRGVHRWVVGARVVGWLVVNGLLWRVAAQSAVAQQRLGKSPPKSKPGIKITVVCSRFMRK